MQHDSIINRANEWASKEVGCVAGRREMQKGRILIEVVSNKLDVLATYAHFVASLHKRQSIACMFISADELKINGSIQAIERIRRLADLMSVLSRTPPEELINGGRLGKAIRTLCPVTNQIVDFDDFNGIAFTPEAANPHDPLYDPMMAAPYACMNLNSDHFAFSMFTRDLCLLERGCEVHELRYAEERREIFEQASAKWQGIACKTINNYVSMTDTARCPTHLTEDERHWYASHQDPAFAETRKELHRHEMPVIYTRRIIDAWERFFETGETPRLSNATVPGFHCHPNRASAG